MEVSVLQGGTCLCIFTALLRISRVAERTGQVESWDGCAGDLVECARGSKGTHSPLPPLQDK